MEIIIIFIILCIIGIFPILFSSFLKYLVYNSCFKLDKINFKDLIKKSWLFSFLWLLSIFICFIVFLLITDYTDNLLIRIIVSLGFAFILLLLNFINLKKIEPINSINKKFFKIFYTISFSFSILIISTLFYKFYPNEIIKLDNFSDFNYKISNISSCDSKLKYINQNITQGNRLLYAEYNKTEEKVVMILKVDNNLEKTLFSKLIFNKINKDYLDSNFIMLNDVELKDPTKKIDIKDFTTQIIGKSIVYSYSIDTPPYSIDLAKAYHYYEQIELNCDDFFESHSNLDFFYDKHSRCLVLVEEIGNDGP